MAEANNSARSTFGSDEWMLEQQVRAEVEAEGWRRLRADLSTPPPAPAPASIAAPAQIRAPQLVEGGERYHRSGSAVLKGLVRFAIGVFGAYLSYIAAMDAGAGEFEVWLWVGSGFVVALALTAFGPGRAFVHFMAETARWVLILTLCVSAVWAVVQASAQAGG